MNVEFTVAEREFVAFTERFYEDSPLHQRNRNQSRWAMTIILLPVMLTFVLVFGFSLLPTAIFVIAMVGWCIIAPRRYDARVRRHAEQQTREPSYAKLFGKYVVRLDGDAIRSEGPTGQAQYKWSAVDRVVLTEDFLFIFLAGPTGFPIPVSEIGAEQAKLAYDRAQQLILQAKDQPSATAQGDGTAAT